MDSNFIIAGIQVTLWNYFDQFITDATRSYDCSHPERDDEDPF